MKKKKIKWKNLCFILLIILFLILLIISIVNIIKWQLDSNNINKQLNKINDIIKIEETKNYNDEEIIEQKEEIPESNLYWDYIKQPLINVNFEELKKINSDTKGWIQVNGTNINYPFVQTSDNKYYLNHSFEKLYNDAGWVFLDYRNNINSISKNTILYAHARKDRTMFGSLKNILKNGWLNNADNYIIKLSTENENTLWQVFSIYHIPTTNDYIKVNFNNNEEFVTWANMLLNRSSHNFNTSINEEDVVLTLSTCYTNDEKVVLHAKLIKKETR